MKEKLIKLQAVFHNQSPSSADMNLSVVRNVVEDSSNTENVKVLNPLTYPQGKIKKCEQLFNVSNPRVLR